MNRYFTIKRTWQPLTALLLIVTSFLIMIYMIYVEDEPGAIPLLMLLTGLGWTAQIRHQKRNA